MNIFIVCPMPQPGGLMDEFGGEALPDKVQKFFRSKDSAIAYARDRAVKKPGLQVVVIGPVTNVIESMEPVVVEKVVSDTGEIIPKV